MTITQYNSNNSLTPEFKWAFSIKEIIWMNSLTYRLRLKKDIWSKFLTQDQTSRQAQSGIRAKLYSWSTIHRVLHDLPQKSTIRALFRAKSVDPKTYLPPSARETSESLGCSRKRVVFGIPCFEFLIWGCKGCVNMKHGNIVISNAACNRELIWRMLGSCFYGSHL